MPKKRGGDGGAFGGAGLGGETKAANAEKEEVREVEEEEKEEKEAGDEDAVARLRARRQAGGLQTAASAGAAEEMSARKKV